MVRRTGMYLLCAVLAGLLFVSCVKGERPVITVKGSTTIDPVIKKLAVAYKEKKDVSIDVIATGSHNGLDELIQGACDIAESSSVASPEYVKKAKEKGITLKSFLVAHDFIVPVVHPANPVEKITLKQLRDIYTGKINIWDRHNDNSGKILLVCRDSSSGTADVWREALGIGNVVLQNVSLQKSNSGVLAYVAENRDALGYVSSAFLNSEVKELAVYNNGLKESHAEQDRYTIYRDLYLYVAEERFSSEARSFIVFILSKEGQDQVRKSGFVPAAEKNMKPGR